MELAIHTEGLTRDFDSVRAVNDLSIKVPRGAIFGFLGPNGSGKTTTIRLLLGLLEPSAGRGQVLGCDILSQAEAIRSRTGALLEHDGLYERLSGVDNLEFYGRIWRMPQRERAARIEQVLKQLDLWDRRHEPVGHWSRGMRQKLAVGRALFHRPDLIFLDEPTAALDPVAASALRKEIANLARQEGVTVFLTTHNLTEAERLCDQVAVIRRGSLLAVGSPAELRGHNGGNRLEIIGRGFTLEAVSGLTALPGVVGAVVEDTTLTVEVAEDMSPAPLVAHLVRAGAEVEEVRRVTASLEDVFLTLVDEERSSGSGAAGAEQEAATW
ncbi:MAG: ABC transporter ATP-binding protein [Anaerolineae bacterium]